MAQGTLTVFDAAKEGISGHLDLSNNTDYSLILLSALPVVDDAAPDSGTYTAVSNGGGYSGPTALATTWDEVTGTVTFDSSVNPSWTAAAGSPTNIRAALVYSETAASPDGLAFIDLTNSGDGTTPISLVDGNITITFAGQGLFTLA